MIDGIPVYQSPAPLFLPKGHYGYGYSKMIKLCKNVGIVPAWVSGLCRCRAVQRCRAHAASATWVIVVAISFFDGVWTMKHGDFTACYIFHGSKINHTSWNIFIPLTHHNMAWMKKNGESRWVSKHQTCWPGYVVDFFWWVIWHKFEKTRVTSSTRDDLWEIHTPFGDVNGTRWGPPDMFVGL